MTDLSKSLRVEFVKIRNTTNLLSNDFKKIIDDAKNTSNIAQKYLVAQKATQVLTEKINELKSKSGYLDTVSLQFKKDELELQKRITTAQISRLLKSTALDAAAKKQAIDSLKLKMILSDTELDYLEKNIGSNNRVIDSLNQQLNQTQGIFENIQLTEGAMIDTSSILGTVKSSFQFLLGKSGLIVKDLGKLGEYLQNGVTPAILLSDIIQKGYENFKAFDKTAVSVRSHLGLLPGEAKRFETLIKQVGIETMHLGASFEDVGKSIKAIADEFTSLVATDRSLLITTTALSKQFGITESTSLKFLKTLGGISGKTVSSQQSMIGFAKKMAEASGVPLPIIMRDVAEASDDVRIYVGSSAVSMIKAATAARMMGIDLNKAASTAEKLLQFETSIGAELKASALLGQNINFNYARQLFFNKNIIDGNKEILRIAKQVRFNQLNPIQQKAFADAAGKSVSELQDMFQQEKNIALVKNGTNKEAKKALEDYENLMKLKDAEAKNEGEIAAQEIIRRANQERLLQIQNRFNKLMSELAEPVMDVTERLLDIAIKILPPILNAIKYMTPIIGVLRTVYIIGEEIGKIGNSLIRTMQYFNVLNSRTKSFFTSLRMASVAFFTIYDTGRKATATFGILQKFIGSILSIGTRVSSIFTTIGGLITKIPLLGGPLIKVLGIFGKFLGPLGVVINIFTFLSSLMKRWEQTPKGFLGGLQAIGGALYDALVQPFVDAYNWIASLFVAKSPSKLGLGIVKGISSIGTMLFNVLIAPFKSAFNLVNQLFNGNTIKFIVSSLQNASVTIFNIITTPYKMLWNMVKKLFSTDISSVINSTSDVITNLFSVIGTPIIEGIKNIGSSIIDVLTSPFKTSFNWIMDNLGGKSPSKIGLGILDGITSVQSKLFENITNPFNDAFKSITNSAPIDLGSTITFGLKDGLMSAIDPFKSSLNAVFLEFGEKLSTEIASSIAKGIKSSESIITDSIKTNISDIKLPVTEFTVDSVEKSTAVKKIETTTSPLQQVIEVSNQQLVQKLDQLITLMSNGGIAVNLDGQLVSRGLATSTYKSGGFGQSTTRA